MFVLRCDFEMYRLVRGWAAVRVREWRGVVFSSRVCGAQWSAVVLVISVAYIGPETCRSACRRGTEKERRTCVFLL